MIALAPSSVCMASSDHYVAGTLGQRLSQDKSTIVATKVMMAELQKLHRKAVVLCAVNNVTVPHLEEVAYALHRHLYILHRNITVSAHKTESFFASFDNLD
jgi:hypothetical protein